MISGLALIGQCASGTVAAERLAALYTSSWAGLPAGEIRFGLTADADHYAARLGIETAGLPRWFTRFNAEVADDGRFVPHGPPAPAHYAAHFNLRKQHDRLISFTFAARDGASQAERDAVDTSTKPQLEAKYRRDILDPLAALVAIRRRLAEDMPAPDQLFVIPVYDGARRFDVNAAVAGDQRDGLIHLDLTLKPIAGFKGESSDQGDPDSAPRPVEVTFTRDARLMPVSMRVRIAFLPFVVRLERTCDDYKTCGAAPPR